MTSGEITADVEDNLINEKDFADYLRQHPDFFERHPSLLAQLVIPHPHSGQAVSLLERKVMVMREQQDETQKKLRELVSNARVNERLTQGMDELAIFLIECNDRAELLEGLPSKLKRLFNLDFICVQIPLEQTGNKLIKDDHRVYCSEALDTESLTALFAEHAGEIASAAIIPVRDGSDGVIVLGARDARRYARDSGTRYLTHLQRMINTKLEQLRRLEQS